VSALASCAPFLPSYLILVGFHSTTSEGHACLFIEFYSLVEETERRPTNTTSATTAPKMTWP